MLVPHPSSFRVELVVLAYLVNRCKRVLLVAFFD